MAESSCPSKFVEYLDSFQKQETGFYQYYTLFNMIHLEYNRSDYGSRSYVGKTPRTSSSSIHSLPLHSTPISSITRLNISADEEEEEPKPIIEKHIEVGKVENISHLLQIIDDHPYEDGVRYNIDLRLLSSIREELAQINAMIGMHQLKCNVVDQLLYFIQNFHKDVPAETAPITPVEKSEETSKIMTKDLSKLSTADLIKGFVLLSADLAKAAPEPVKSTCSDFKHTVIYGPPGTGKTEIAKLIGKMYSKIGVLSSKNIFKKVTRSDLVAGYLGQTAIKTKTVIQESLGGVLFIDEAYALGNANDNDSFSRECIDTLCEALSDHKDSLMVIVAGYEAELEKHFFGANQGLESRFIWRFTIDKYTPTELKDIFAKKARDAGWELDPISPDWFDKNKTHFQHYGRDMERLFFYAKISHSRRVFGLSKDMHRRITKEDMEAGRAMFLKNKKKTEKEDLRREIISSMYV